MRAAIGEEVSQRPQAFGNVFITEANTEGGKEICDEGTDRQVSRKPHFVRGVLHFRFCNLQSKIRNLQSEILMIYLALKRYFSATSLNPGSAPSIIFLSTAYAILK